MHSTPPLDDGSAPWIVHIYRFVLMVLRLFCTSCYASCKDFAKLFDPKNWREKDISGKLVVITGGCGCLGLKMASEFLERGARMLLLDINAKVLEEAAAKLQTKFESGYIATRTCDVSDYDAMCRVANEIVADPELGTPDILICGAGVLFCDYLIDASPLSIRKTFDINWFGVVWTVKSFLPFMVEANKGHIVLISSGGGLAGGPGGAVYCASKFAVTGLGESLHSELAEMRADGMNVSILHPFFTQSPLLIPCTIQSPYIPIILPDVMAKECVKMIMKGSLFQSFPSYILPGFATKYFVSQTLYETWRDLICVKFGLFRGKA